MIEQFANNATSTLDGGINNVVTTLDVASAATFPTAGRFRILIDSEILIVTAVAGDTFTVTRGAEGTSAAAHSNGATVTAILTQVILEQVRTVAITKESDETVNNSAVYQDDADLVFAMKANETWIFDITIFLTGPTAGDFKVTMSLPVGASIVSGVHGLVAGVTDGDGDLYAYAGSGADHQSIGAPSASFVCMVLFRGRIVNGANAGNAQAQWAQQSATGSDTTIKAGSHLTAHLVVV